ncbi:MAG: tRNA (adenosine(37)-N6)-dimethylallyltransferase MiaA [Bacteroidia bacterium]|nr:tRNA (adenosine(37)-N6)-dimethylallyltransferase MiaA [Bacteroidia bacterium]
MHHKLIIIGGPTASGKSALAMQLAEHYSTEIISADSRQCYRELNIGTAKPDPADLNKIKHHFVHSHSIHEPFNAGIFAEEAKRLLQTLFGRYEVVIVVGGTGLYLKALTEGLDDFPAIEEQNRNQVKEMYKREGLSGLTRYLTERDPDFLAQADALNPARLMRAAEIILQSGMPFSSFTRRKKSAFPWDTIKMVPDWDRNTLYSKINARVDQMMEAGLLDEVKTLFPYRSLKPLQTVGYSELFDHLEGKYDLQTAIQRIKQHSRNYAKRQITWFKNQDQYLFLPHERAYEKVLEMMDF